MPVQWYVPQTYCNTSATTNVYYPANAYYTTTASPNTIWGNWVNQTITTTQLQTYSNHVWTEWNQTPIYVTQQSSYTPPPPLTPEQQRERQRCIEEQRRQGEERQRERVAACARARTLLDGFLDDGQKAELERHGRFHVRGSRGRRYCIRTTGQAGNVDLLKEDGSLQATLCCHPRGYLPDGDAWLMQMIEIRHDEDHFLQTANVHRGVLPVAVAA